MIRLRADDRTGPLSDQQVLRIQFWMLEVAGARDCEVTKEPPVVILVPDEDLRPEDLSPLVLAKLEAIVGGRLQHG